MSSANAPYPYFNGITYNSSFFSSSSSSSTGLTQEQANSLYLRKTTTDTATALETFSGGISSTTIQATCNITANAGLTLGDGNGITCPTISPTLGKTNLNYTYTFNNVAASSSAVGTTYAYSPASNNAGAGNYLNAGVYAVFVNSVVYELGGPSTGSCAYTLGVCYGSTTGTLSTTAQYGTATSVSKQSNYQRLNQNNFKIGTALAGTFTLTSANFVNIQLSNNITIAFTGGNFWSTVDGLIIRIG